ncbi:DNA polymerase III subunit gamma/tau [Gilvimarinus agarilyticus]|uniref:DNA polymerase III subunit gamma/tau n=1 Tax=Gilvimarinus sp. 2_MG-2023 TaxID=3062666 RepID=UPI001C086B00|nr:DNA polymerase III subunit gamma/tau [Gilvimarinus sp. 2_MG-2023]MBU2885938.1 DNA polymerase III subunit gamma/tau [Gilvimarinus agarilyticus]MDO6570684.1 DNA polymerase III subunit gamma/tau [Gilvimarinus sp. 2_MG-2023]
MSYQVLARKWRPRTFRDLVGQEHVLQALVNALDHDRLHHAYLFTGTRGVGKTTIARILAKCLNCEAGVSSTPCGQCSACVEIAENRFVDLIEVDAASRTKVEDTRELLENVQYAPTRGRYKVYLIDEVHMLSTHSFNALLKTLEEPPPHVKFLLATTDPQRLPVTILSRCLQFNLKNMTPELVTGHLQHVLEAEAVPFEESALWQLGRAADGSMRDALSLTDQAIAFGSGKVTEAQVRTMLGTIDRSAVYDILQALAVGDAKAVLQAVAQMAEHAPDFASALADLLSILHRVAIGQALPEAVDNSQGDRDQVLALATQLPSEDVQLFYQTGLLGRRDLPLAPEPRAGLEMVLLRMLAFRPQGVTDVPSKTLPASAGNAPEPAAPAPAPSVVPAPTESAPAVSAPEVSPPEVEPTRSDASQVDSPAAAMSEPAPQSAAPEQAVPSQSAPVANSQHPVSEDPPPWDNAPESMQAESVPDVEISPPEPSANYRSEPHQAPAQESLQQSPQEPPQAAPPQRPQAPVQTPSQPSVSTSAQPAVQAPTPSASVAPPRAPVERIVLDNANPTTWPQIFLGLDVGGMLQNTAANCELVGRQANQFHFVLDENNSSLYSEGHQQRLADALTDYFQQPVQVMIQPGTIDTETPAQIAERKRSARLTQAVEAVKSDPIVQQLIEHFSATLDESTVEPVDSH